MCFISVIIKKFCQITKTEPTTIEHATRITTRSKSMQTDERSSPLKADSDNIFPCPCSVCVPTYGKDFSSETALMAPPRETMSRHHRLLGFTGPPIPMLPYTQIPGSPTRLLMPYALHRAPYQRAVFAPDACYRSGSVQETPKQEILRESHLIQTESLTPNPDASGRYWDRSGNKGPHEKSRRMRTVFSPQQLDRLERYFKNQQYVGSAQRIIIASQLGLSETQVKVWFQNRRIRWRKTALNGPKKTLTEDQES